MNNQAKHMHRKARSMFIALLMTLITACDFLGPTREPETYILPENYVGIFYIIFNMPQGQPRKEMLGGRAYEIPKSGVLFTQMGLNPGWLGEDKIKFFYRMKNGELREITGRWSGSFPDTPEERADTQIRIFGGGIGTFQFTLTSCEIVNQDFHIGTKRDILDGVGHFEIEKIPGLEKIRC